MKSDVLTVTKFVDIHINEITAHRKLANADIRAQHHNARTCYDSTPFIANEPTLTSTCIL